jgi:Uma2 family endonuclease
LVAALSRTVFEFSDVHGLVIDPDERQVDVYAPNEPPKRLSMADTLTLSDILPGFSVAIAQLFQ